MPSLMNGLSAMGQGISTFAGNAGLEAQKAGLAQQQTILADQLATTRETTLQGQQQTFQAGQNTQAQGATAALATQAQAAAAANVATEQAGASARNAATEAGATARTQMTINAPPETIKLLRALGVPLPGDAPQASGPTPASDASGASTPPLPGPRASGGVAADGSIVSPSGGTSPQTTGSASGGAASGTAMDNPLVRKALGMPQAGSPEATRMAIAQDVNADPAFKYKTAGQKAAEIESRVAVAEGKLTSPDSREDMAKAIASYQIAPLASFALTKPGGPETMARVMQLNPDYQESRYPEVNKAMSAFGSGKQGDIVRSLNVGVQHLDVLDQAGQAMGNGDVRALNSLKNTFQQQFGSSAPTTFEGLKQIVGTEVEKSVAGGIGSASDRDRIMKALDAASSPAQLQAITDGFRSLMIGQLSGLKTQYEEATGFKSGPFVFESKLVPQTIKALHSGGAPAPASAAASSTAPDPIAMAQDAISRGAPAAAVMQRLRDNGINPAALMGQSGDVAGPGRD